MISFHQFKAAPEVPTHAPRRNSMKHPTFKLASVVSILLASATLAIALAEQKQEPLAFSPIT